MAGIWDGIGTGMLGGVLNAGLNEFGKFTNYLWNEKSAQNAYGRQREFYEDYQSWAAQMRQLKEAGLSPSMLMGGAPGATGGTSTAQGAGAQGPAGQFFQLNPKLAAEIEVLKSQANLNNKAAGKEEALTGNLFADTAKKLSETENIEQDTTNKKVYEQLLQLDTIYKTIQNEIADATTESQINYINYKSDAMFHESQYMYEMAAGQQLKNRWTEETWNLELQKISAENENIIADTFLKNSGVQLNNAQIVSLISHVGIDWYKAYIEQQKVNVEKDKLEAQINQWAKENKIAMDQIDATKRGQTLSTIANIVGSLLMAAAIAMPNTNLNVSLVGK